MNSFDESKVRRSTDGKFAHKPHFEADVSLVGTQRIGIDDPRLQEMRHYLPELPGARIELDNGVQATIRVDRRRWGHLKQVYLEGDDGQDLGNFSADSPIAEGGQRTYRIIDDGGLDPEYTEVVLERLVAQNEARYWGNLRYKNQEDAYKLAADAAPTAITYARWGFPYNEPINFGISYSNADQSREGVWLTDGEKVWTYEDSDTNSRAAKRIRDVMETPEFKERAKRAIHCYEEEEKYSEEERQLALEIDMRWPVPGSQFSEEEADFAGPRLRSVT